MTILNTADALLVGVAQVEAVYASSDLAWPQATPVATVTIPSGTVASTLTNFVTRVDLSDLPASWWYALTQSDGREIRVKQAGTVIPFDVVNIATAYRVGDLFFKATLNSGSDNVFTVEVVAGATALAVADPNGRNAVWADYDEVYVGSTTSRKGTGHDLTLAGGAMISSLEVTGRSPNVTAHQGVTRDDDGNWYVIGTDEIVKYSPAWTEVARATTPLADTGVAAVNHMGDGTVHDGELYVVFEEWPNSPYDNQHVGVWDLDTLAFVRSYNISAQGHEVSGICFNPDDGHFYLATYDDTAGSNVLRKYTTSFGYVGTLTMSASIISIQGVDYSRGNFWITSDVGSSQLWRIYRVSTAGTVAEVWRGALNSAIEGIHADLDGTLHVLWDNATTTDSRVYTYAQAAAPWVNPGDTGRAYATGTTARTAWTMGASCVFGLYDGTNHQTVMGYGTPGNDATANPKRASLDWRNTGNFGIWNNTDSWLMDTGAAPVVGTRYRLHHTQNGTTDRKVWRNGVVGATDLTVVQRPVTGDAITIGDGLTTGSLQSFRGQIGYAYLRNGVLSANWLAAEFESWETPASFYAVTV